MFKGLIGSKETIVFCFCIVVTVCLIVLSEFYWLACNSPFYFYESPSLWFLMCFE